MWKKILFIGIAIVIGIVVYFLGYNSNQANHIYDMVNEAIENEHYSDVARILGGCFDPNSIYKDDSDDYDIVIYPATSLTTRVNYGENDVYYHYENAYYLYLFKTRFSVDKTSSGMQKTGFRFYSDSGSYDYHFIVNSDTNSDEYKSNPSNLEEVLLNQEHQNLTNTELKFVNCTLTQSQINQISSKIGGNITKMGIINSSGDEIDQFDISLDFSETFFSKEDGVAEFVTAFDQYLQNALAAEGDKTKTKELEKEFSEYSNNWEHNVFPALAEEHGYTLRFENSILSPASLVWKTIGMLALYALVIVIFYILIFHFSKIKRIFSKETYKDYGKRRGGETYINEKRVADKQENKSIEKNQDSVIDAEVEEKEKEEEEEKNE